MTERLAIVQHGDYREALRLRDSGAPEPYAGMYDSVEMTERLIEGTTYRIISLDAPNYRVDRGPGDLVGFSAPRWKKGAKLPWAWRTYRAVREFRPSKILMRTGGILAAPVLRYAIARDLDVLVMLAGYVPSGGARDRFLNRFLVESLNDPHIRLVGNHRRPAADSLIAAGVRPEKVVAYEFQIKSRPDQHPVKAFAPGLDPRIAFVGTLGEGKGIGDILEAVIRLNQSGARTLLTICGAGPMDEQLRERARALPEGLVEFRGRVGNDEALQVMKGATFVAMASRKEASEGMPIVVTEALASRTPLLASNHPCLTDILVDGEGLRYFPSGDAEALARLIREVADDPESYARLSESTADAWSKVVAPVQLHEPIEEWKEGWKSAGVEAGAGDRDPGAA